MKVLSPLVFPGSAWAMPAMLRIAAKMNVAFFMFSNLLFAGNPKISSAEDNLADLLIDKMGKDVILTDSQKIVVKAKLKIYIVKIQNAHALINKEENFSKKNQASIEYQSSLDSILTPSQNQQLHLKVMERENAK